MVGVAALGLMLAAVVGSLLAPGGGVDDAVRCVAANIITNQLNQIYVSYSLTNAGKKAVTLVTIATEMNTNGAWIRFQAPGGVHVVLKPGESTNACAWIPLGGQKWRAQLAWFADPPRFQRLGFRLRETAGAIVPRLRPSGQDWINLIGHTNYLPEVPR